MVKAAMDTVEFRSRADRAMLVLYASVVESLGWATVALLDQDAEVAGRVIEGDRKIDDQANDLTGLIKDRLSEATVEPDELEDLIALLQMVPELERSADLAEHIAQRARQGLGGTISPRARGLIQCMCDVGIRMWQLASRAYAERSRDLSFEINEADDELDNLSADLLREGAAFGGDPAVAAELALLARFYERIGDHAVNLARRCAALAAPRRLSPLRALRRRRDAEGDGPNGARSLRGRIRGFRLIPQDDSFVRLFEGLARNARLCSAAIVDMVIDVDAVEGHYQEARTFERQGDEMTVELLRRLDATFVTPYDREDIHALAEALDDVLDTMFAAAERIYAIHVETILPEVKQQADNLAVMGTELEHLVGCLSSKMGARHRLQRIEELERVGDAIHRRSMARLFSGDYEALEVLKWKDIVESLEDAANQIEEASDVVESILVKEG
jgi:predicted phosphate transport protein (TIGR00153 family)